MSQERKIHLHLCNKIIQQQDLIQIRERQKILVVIISQIQIQIQVRVQLQLHHQVVQIVEMDLLLQQIVQTQDIFLIKE